MTNFTVVNDAEMAALVRDAERYRFMRGVVERYDIVAIGDAFDAVETPTSSAGFDAAVDSVMAAHPLKTVDG